MKIDRKKFLVSAGLLFSLAGGSPWAQVMAQDSDAASPSPATTVDVLETAQSGPVYEGAPTLEGGPTTEGGGPVYEGGPTAEGGGPVYEGGPGHEGGPSFEGSPPVDPDTFSYKNRRYTGTFSTEVITSGDIGLRVHKSGRKAHGVVRGVVNNQKFAIQIAGKVKGRVVKIKGKNGKDTANFEVNLTGHQASGTFKGKIRGRVVTFPFSLTME